MGIPIIKYSLNKWSTKKEEKRSMKCVTQYNKTMGLRAGGLGFFFFIILLFLNNKVHWIWMFARACGTLV